MFKKFLRDEKGQDVIEWGLLAAFLGILLVGTISLTDIETTVQGWYESVEALITT